MRTTKILISVCAAVIVAAGSTTAALAQMKKSVKPSGGVTAVKPQSKAVPLTNNECLGLGGDVHTTNAGECVTGKYCQTTTVSKTGVKHVNVQCITKLE